MPRYYFHLINDLDCPDPEGKELPDIEAAREHAGALIRFTAAESIKERGKFDRDHRIDIEDDAGEVIETIHFDDAVEIEGGSFLNGLTD